MDRHRHGQSAIGCTDGQAEAPTTTRPLPTRSPRSTIRAASPTRRTSTTSSPTACPLTAPEQLRNWHPRGRAQERRHRMEPGPARPARIPVSSRPRRPPGRASSAPTASIGCSPLRCRLGDVTYLNPIAYDRPTAPTPKAFSSPTSVIWTVRLPRPCPPSRRAETSSPAARCSAAARSVATAATSHPTIDGTTYTYDPANSGSVTATGGTNPGSFDSATNTLTVNTARAATS